MASTYRDVGLVLIGAALMAVFLYIRGNNQISRQFEQLVTNSKTKTIEIQKNDDASISMKNERFHQYYLQQSKERQKILGGYLAPLNATYKDSFGPFYNGLVAEIVCPWMVRVGNVNDGGKWVCNPWELPTNCVIYSLGVGTDITFETEMDEVVQHRCKIYSFDSDGNRAQRFDGLKPEIFLFTQLLIVAPQDTNLTLNRYSIQDVMKRFQHTFIDFFKIDIENGEYSTMPSMLTDAKKPVACQIFIEMHGSPSQCAELLSLFAKAGFWMFSYELNGYHPELSEYSFLHESCFARYGVTSTLARNFPI